MLSVLTGFRRGPRGRDFSGAAPREPGNGFDRRLYKAAAPALYFVFYFAGRARAHWTRTLTALVVMLYNALSTHSLDLVPSPPPLPERWHFKVRYYFLAHIGGIEQL